MHIVKRLEKGWSGCIVNDSKTVCDDCGAKLWKGPGNHSWPYCDKIHKK